jgi:hypothetical protein
MDSFKITKSFTKSKKNILYSQSSDRILSIYKRQLFSIIKIPIRKKKRGATIYLFNITFFSFNNLQLVFLHISRSDARCFKDCKEIDHLPINTSPPHIWGSGYFSFIIFWAAMKDTRASPDSSHFV